MAELPTSSNCTAPNSQVRNQCLATITKILHFSEPKALGEQLANLPISSFIAGLLSQKSSSTVAKALQLGEILMHKLPDVFSKYFLKEGVVHAVDQLAATAPQLAVEEKAKSKAAKRASQRLKVTLCCCSASPSLAVQKHCFLLATSPQAACPYPLPGPLSLSVRWTSVFA